MEVQVCFKVGSYDYISRDTCFSAPSWCLGQYRLVLRRSWGEVVKYSTAFTKVFTDVPCFSVSHSKIEKIEKTEKSKTEN
jgi:hypothetical protein